PDPSGLLKLSPERQPISEQLLTNRSRLACLSPSWTTWCRSAPSGPGIRFRLISPTLWYFRAATRLARSLLSTIRFLPSLARCFWFFRLSAFYSLQLVTLGLLRFFRLLFHWRIRRR